MKNKNHLLSIFAFLTWFLGSNFSPQEVILKKTLIPSPKQYQIFRGYFNDTGKIAFNHIPEKGLGEASIRLTVKGSLKLADTPSSHHPEKGLVLIIGYPQVKSESSEAYRLKIGKDRITVTSQSPNGIRMGLRTLAQLTIDGSIPQCEVLDWPDMSLRGTHLCYHLIREDLAYNCPNFEALIEHVDRLASVKQNAVLAELESMFPYKKHKKISCKLAFTDEQITNLKDRLKLHGMEFIPLVQCLGHAYSVLIHDEYTEYRELPNYIQQFCPTNPEVTDLYMEFVDEYLEVFPDIQYWHMGGDESRMLGRCPRCQKKIDELGISRLYVDHVAEIARRIHERGLIPIIWSDMLEHHPEAISMLPKYLTIMYWNYDLAKWSRPYPVKKFMEMGFSVIGASAVRSGSAGTELSVYYHDALRGIESLPRRIHRDGCRQIIATNWMKGSPHENTDYGLVYAADLAWNVNTSRQDFQRRYAKLTFGLDDPKICSIYETLSMWLPYAEPVLNYQTDRLNRFDLSGFRFHEKWERYSQPEKEPEVLQYLKEGILLADEAIDLLEQLTPKLWRGKRQVELLKLSAECIDAKARLALALHKGNCLLNNRCDKREIEAWTKEIPEIVNNWQAAKKRHLMMLTETGFEPCVKFLNELMFEPAEVEFLKEIYEKIRNYSAH